MELAEYGGPANFGSTPGSTTNQHGKAGNVKDTCSVEVDERTLKRASSIRSGNPSTSFAQTAGYVGVWNADDVSPGTKDNVITNYGYVEASVNSDDPGTLQALLREIGSQGIFTELTSLQLSRRAHFQTALAPLLRHIDQSTKMDRERRLIEHWIDYPSDELAPVRGPKNPLKTILVPMAYEGALAPACDSIGSVALFHLICAASASQLSTTSATSETAD